MTDPLKLLLGAAMDTSGGFVDEGVGGGGRLQSYKRCEGASERQQRDKGDGQQGSPGCGGRYAREAVFHRDPKSKRASGSRPQLC